MTSRDRTFMRTQLAQVGIILTEPTPRIPPGAATATAAEPVDRELVRVILADAGAPLADLEWLVASCPSVDDALNYQPLRGASFARTDAAAGSERATPRSNRTPAASPRLGEPATWPRGSW